MMKRIGILTYHRSINYGAYLQSYALSNEIRTRFPEHKVEIVDMVMETKYQNYRKDLRKFPFFYEYWIKYKAFQKDVRKLPLTEQKFIINYFDSFTNYLRKEYDIIVVGSDAVWNFEKKQPGNPYWIGDTELENPYWLFGEKLTDVVKMSYAASAYLTDFKNVPKEKKLYFTEMLKSFQYIGVRDQETANFIQSLVPEKQVNRNCDPTFLLPGSKNQKFARRILRKNFVNPNRQIISFMTAGLPIIKEIKRYLGKSYTFVHFNHRDRNRDILDRDTRLLINLSPLEWYTVYNQCTLNFSHYFHGTIVGLRNNVPTLSFDKTNFPYPYVGKNEQVMRDLKLDDYLFFQKTINDQNEKDRVFEQIDFALKNLDTERKRIETYANIERERSESFFNALKTFL